MARTAAPPTRVTRHFLGWDRPPLDSIAGWLGDRLGLTSLLPSSDAPPLVVVPGARAGRLLLARLVRAAEDRGITLHVPTIITPGRLTEELTGPAPDRPAGEIQRRLAWARAMTRVPPDVLALVVPAPPPSDDLLAWMALAGWIERASEELASHGLRFADVPARAQSRRLAIEPDRWRALGAIQEAMESTLREAGLVDPGLSGLERLGHAEFQTREVVLAGVVELGGAARQALTRASVASLILAPHTLADAFDELGCVRPGSAGCFPAPADGSIRFADGPRDQAREALDAIAAIAGRADQVVIGAPDTTLVPLLVREARRRGARVRDAGGEPARRQPAVRLARRIAAYLDDPSAETLGGLLTHPRVEHWLRASAGLRGVDRALDHHRARRLGRRLDDGPGLPDSVRAARDRIGAALAPLASCAGTISGAARALPSAMAPFHAGVRLDPQRPADARELAALEAIRDAADELAHTPAPLDGRASASRAASIIAEFAGARALPGDPDPRAIELVGWLELALDPAPGVVIVGLNEGVVPRRAAEDPLLSDRLREALGMPGDRARLARDEYLLALAGAPWRRCVIIAGRASRAGEPRWPSRLLLRGDAAAVARRLERFASARSDEPPPRPGPARAAIRVILPHEPVREMSVTSFRTYLRSPYQYYLERVLRRRDDDERGRELDAAGFGTLLHAAIDAFGRDPDSHDGDEPRVRSMLLDHLRRAALDALGPEPPPAARIQIELAERRLVGLAAWHAARVRDGWQTLSLGEWSPSAPVVLAHDDGETILRGRIDRVERHARRGDVAILDYKVVSSAVSPERAHRRDGRWIDLQLPLYLLLARELIGDARVTLGYVALSGRGPVREALATWTDAEIADAHATARGVALDVWRGKFEELGEPVVRVARGAHDIMAHLCATEPGP